MERRTKIREKSEREQQLEVKLPSWNVTDLQLQPGLFDRALQRGWKPLSLLLAGALAFKHGWMGFIVVVGIVAGATLLQAALRR